MKKSKFTDEQVAFALTCSGISGPHEVRISTWHQGERHAKEEDLTGEDHLAAAPD